METRLRSRSKSREDSIIIDDVDEFLKCLCETKLDNNNSSLKNFEVSKHISIPPEDLSKKILEIAETRELEKANNKLSKRRNKIELLDDELEDIIKKQSNDSKADTRGTDSLKKKHKKNRSHKYTLDDFSYVPSEDDKDELSESSYNYDNSESNSSLSEDNKEIEEFLNRKRFRKTNYGNFRKKSKEKSLLNESSNNESKKTHFRKLKKSTDNKEMKLSLDAECIICCSNIIDLANPDGCNHDFCKECLIEWSQRSSQCPICKQPYYNIFIYDKGIKKSLSISKIRSEYKAIISNSSEEEGGGEGEEEENDDEDVCYICGKSNDETNLLVCDGCNKKFCHYYCLNLKKIPTKNWYCIYCANKMKELKVQKKSLERFFK